MERDIGQRSSSVLCAEKKEVKKYQVSIKWYQVTKEKDFWKNGKSTVLSAKVTFVNRKEINQVVSSRYQVETSNAVSLDLDLRIQCRS